MPRITAANMQALKETMETLIEVWEDVAEPLERWLDFQEAPPTTTEGRELRQEAREELNDGLPSLWDAISELAELVQ